MNKLLKSNYHFIWLVIFFILHGVSEFGSLVTWKDSITVCLLLLSFGYLLFISYGAFQGNKIKAGVASTGLLVVFLFFEAIQRELAGIKLTEPLSKMPILLTVIFFFLCFFLLCLRLKKKISPSLVVYINLVLVIFILFEVFTIVKIHAFKATDNSKEDYNLKVCDTCKKPSVYIVILDEYPGQYTLNNVFHYNNTFFYNQLVQKGFKVVDSSVSNYELTVLSIASMFSMDFLEIEKLTSANERFAYLESFKQINTSPVIEFFRKQGYEIRNYSFFDFNKAPALTKNEFWGGNIRLFTNQTLYGKLKKELPLYLANKSISYFFIDQVENEYLNQIDKSLSESVDREKQDKAHFSKPVFTYIHLNLPHPPLFMDSLGNRISAKIRKSYSKEQVIEAYLQYMVYGNRRIIKWIDEIQEASKGEAVILLMSDHGTGMQLKKGYRRLDNLNAVYIPGADYSKWYKGFSNVNQFRLVLNELFNQNLPLKPDSIP